MSRDTEARTSAEPGGRRRNGTKPAERPTDNPAQYKAFLDTVRRLELGEPENDSAFLDAVEQVLPPRLGRRRGRRPSGNARQRSRN
ncbi:hypothetical protein GR183_17235 [Stappia sp. GBMRC 2046]|uniref:Uncharacterized protein n=1 Tax=Stappia sediminis TaxID=2692190 RepID=A0A7X3LX50_9HYPH|nr:hypothetical protein [Stappia sediminis]MXN66663.1 hypothetical protein [Stappia sediminis]